MKNFKNIAYFVVSAAIVAALAIGYVASKGNVPVNVIPGGQNGTYPSLGPEDASIVITEFSDYQCPFCGAAAGTNQDIIQRLKTQDPTWEPPVPGLEQLAREGKIRFVFRNFPLPIHPYAEKAAEASLIAYEQGKFWEYHDLLYENQGALDVASLKGYAARLGLDTAEFNASLDSGRMAARVQQDIADAKALGITGTPTFVVGGQLLVGAQSFSAFSELIGVKAGS